MRDNLKATVRGYYDTQLLRIQIGGRIVANFKAALGQEPGEKEDQLDDKEIDVLKQLRGEYKKITDGVARFPARSRFKGTRLISKYTELVMVANYADLLKVEDRLYKEVGYLLKDFEIFNQFLLQVKGCGPSMSAVIISEIDIAKAEYPSSLWKLCGFDVAEDGKGRSRRKEHLIKRKYINKKGEEAERNSITFNPWLKTKLAGVLGPSFIKQANEPYSEVYYQYKHRLEHHDVYKDVSKGHRHSMAIRYMIKRFLVDLHIAWRTVEGLSVSDDYATAKLGMKHKVA